MKTVSSAKMMMLYRPVPTPPGETSPSIMLSIMRPPPRGLIESCIMLTPPVEVPVVAVPNSTDPTMPKRCSLPSIEPSAPLVSAQMPRPALRVNSAPMAVVNTAP